VSLKYLRRLLIFEGSQGFFNFEENMDCRLIISSS